MIGHLQPSGSSAAASSPPLRNICGMKTLAKRALKRSRSERAASCRSRLVAKRPINRPDETGQLARDCGHRNGVRFAFLDERPIAR
jgi:hypothetical protein